MGSAKKPQQPKPTHLLTARKPVHEDGGRDHDAPVVTTEKVVIARQKARALTVMSGMLREKTWWQWCLDSVFKTKKYIIHMLKYVNHVYQDLHVRDHTAMT